MRDYGLGKELLITSSLPFSLLHYPVETVSQSEKGAELTLQGYCFGLSYRLGSSFKLKIELEVKDV